MKTIFLVLLYFDIIVYANAQPVDNLNDIINIPSLDNNINEYLEEISRHIGDRAIVFIGESDHSEDYTLTFKTELIKYLVEKHDFKVLVEEMPFVNSIIINKEFKNSNLDYYEVLKKIKFNFLATSTQFKLYDFYNKNKSDFSIFGLDITAYNENINLELAKFMDLYLTYYAQKRNIKRLRAEFNSIKIKSQYNTNSKDKIYNNYCKLSNSIKKSIKKLDAGNKDTLFNYFLDDYAAFLRWNLAYPPHLYDSSNVWTRMELRDKQMFQNFKVLKENIVPDKKIIVTVSNFHLLKYRDSLSSQYKEWGNFKSFGEVATNYFGKDNIYSIGITGYQGEVGADWIASKSKNLGNNKYEITHDYERIPIYKLKIECGENSLEHYLHLKDSKFSFVNLNGNSVFTSHKLKGYFLPIFPFETNWSNVFDGVFFIDTMKITLREYINKNSIKR